MTFPVRDRKLLFVGGKGGVGKTTCAAALALGLANEQRRVLLVSTDPAHSLADLFDRRIGNRETRLRPGLRALEIDPDAEVKRYLERVKTNMRRFVRPAMYPEIERQMELTRQAPGAVEAALMQRMAELMDTGPDRHDTVIFDTAPTGHTLRLLALPEIMAAWTDGLLRQRERSDSLGRALGRLARRRDAREQSGEERKGPGARGASGDEHTGPEPTGVSGDEHTGPEPTGASGDELSWIDRPEDGPGDERAREIREILLERRRSFTTARRLLVDEAVTALFLVLVPEKLPVLETEKAVQALRRHGVPLAGLVVNRVLPDRPLGDFLESRREQQSVYLERIDRLFAELPRVRVPLLPRDVEGDEGLEQVARHLLQVRG